MSNQSNRRESLEQAKQRWDRLRLLQKAYPKFVPFLRDMMDELGFGTTWLQEDIAEFISDLDLQYVLVMAQRSQAKTTITAIYVVWSMIHAPQSRNLIVSAGGSLASEISTLIVRLIMSVDILEPLRPDRSAGDRTSVESFDVHHSLKGTDKSPSLGCFGITSNIQGKRADLLIADDVESSKNSQTPAEREKLATLTKEFTSINQSGRIIWLGTPQTRDSIYNQLPGRGVTVRIWPGRYPNAEQLTAYGERLAPSIAARLAANPELGTGFGLDGKQGSATDPDLLDNDALLRKEMDQGPGTFQLQHMLLTALLDATRFPLATKLLTLVQRSAVFPRAIVRGFGAAALVLRKLGDKLFQLSHPHSLSQDTSPLRETVAYIDPAGGGANGDETAVAVGGSSGTSIVCTGIRGFPGGYAPEVLAGIAGYIMAQDCKVGSVIIEKNFGYGAFQEVFTPILRKAGFEGAIVEDYVTGRKETRIVKVLEPPMARGALVVTDKALEDDEESARASKRQDWFILSILHQLSNMQDVPGALIKDDRIDALAGLVNHLKAHLEHDVDKALAAEEEARIKALMADPMGRSRITLNGPGRIRGNANILRHRR